MKNTLGVLGLSVALSFSQASVAEEDGVLLPKLNGHKFEVNCKRDFNDRQPTLDFLGRYSSHMHGEIEPVHGRNVNLYVASDRLVRVSATISKNLKFAPPSVKENAIRHMNEIFVGYDRATDKSAFLQSGLQSHNWGGPLRKISQKCQSLGL